jgi:hypothetical protein
MELEWEYKRMIKQNEKNYPSIQQKVVVAEAVDTAKDDYIIRAYFMCSPHGNEIT